MKHPFIILCGFIAGIFIFSGCTSVERVTPMEDVPYVSPFRVIEVTAQKYHFTPEEIRVKQGTVVHLIIKSLDTVHGIAIPRYGIERDIPKQGDGAITVEFYAREAGEYAFHCSNFCGLGHFGMKGKIIVEN